MAVTSVSSTAGSLQNIDPGKLSALKQRREDFQALTKALGANDLPGAQKAFASLQQDMQAILTTPAIVKLAWTQHDGLIHPVELLQVLLERVECLVRQSFHRQYLKVVDG